MDEDKVQKLIADALAPLAKQVADKDAEIATLKADRDKRDKEEADFKRKEAEKKVTMARAEVTKVMDEAVKAKTMTPALRETYAKQIGLDDDDRVQNIVLDEVKLMCGAVKGTDDDPEGKVTKDKQEANPGDELLRLTRKAMAETGNDSFAATFSRVAAANPEIHKEYLDSNGEK